MTNTTGGESFARSNRTRLLVPAHHTMAAGLANNASGRSAQHEAPRMVNRTGRTIQPLSAISKQQGPDVKQAKFMPTIPQYSDQAVQPNLSEADRQAIMRRAAIVREQARRQAEAKARADAMRRLQAATSQPAQHRVAQAPDLTSVMMRSAQPVATKATATTAAKPAFNAFAPASVNPQSDARVSAAKVATMSPATQSVRAVASSVQSVNADQSPSMTVGQAGAAAIAQPNALQRLAGAKITISFKINKQRVLTILRYVAVAVIILASVYLAWDTYTTNQSVKNSFGGTGAASAMSIAGTNPATADQTAVSQEDKAAYTVPSDQPRYIFIPKLGVNARVMSVGVNSKGNIDTPANLNDTAWYDGSAKPGQEGQVFIDGHTSFSSTINAAFNNLGQLQEGDQITIEKGNGEKINYQVKTVKTVAADEVDMGEALNPPEGATKGLTLMTCTGTFNYQTQTADQRLIVYAVQE